MWTLLHLLTRTATAMAALPLGKLAYLAMRQLSKPVSKILMVREVSRDIGSALNVFLRTENSSEEPAHARLSAGTHGARCHARVHVSVVWFDSHCVCPLASRLALDHRQGQALCRRQRAP